MIASDEQQLNASDARTDLKAAVAARRELHPDLEDQVLEAFLARVEARIDRRVSEQIQAARPARGVMRGEPVQVEVIAGSFALAIPLLAIAQVGAHGWGVAAVIIGLVAVNLLYFIDRWVRFN